MKPRELRHRLEKAAKILVTIQKHLPKADCLFDSDKGEQGHIQLDFVNDPVDWDQLKKLGKDLEGKGYQFTQKKLPWIGQISFKGKTDNQPSVVFTLPHTLNRLEINQESPIEAYSFTNS